MVAETPGGHIIPRISSLLTSLFIISFLVLPRPYREMIAVDGWLNKPQHNRML